MENFTAEEFKAIYHDMVLIREFETMLNLIKTRASITEPLTTTGTGAPLHRPGSGRGDGLTLNVDDFIFGSHRSHGEILAKGCRPFTNWTMTS